MGQLAGAIAVAARAIIALLELLQFLQELFKKHSLRVLRMIIFVGRVRLICDSKKQFSVFKH